jgi:tripartite-type tricarboxylate transporter receptor subunit TctC
MTTRTIVIARMLLAAVIAVPAVAGAYDYPTKQVKIIVPIASGASFDTATRLIAEKLREKWGQPVIVENRAGAGHNMGAEAVAKAVPDGYTLLSAPPPSLVINKSLYGKLAFDPDAFVPISVVLSTYNLLAVNPKVTAESVQQLIDFAKANPGRLNYASAGSGTTPHLAAELFNTMAGVRIVHIPYKGTSPAIMDLMAGQVEVMFVDVGLALPHIRSGRLRLLAVASEKRSIAFPDVPAMSEFLPGFLSVIWMGMAAPAGTPPSIATQIAGTVSEILKQPDVAKRLQELNFDPIGSTPEEMAQFMAQERERWGKVIRSSGATAN